MLQLSSFSSFSSFFNQIASKYVSRYNQIAQDTTYAPTPIAKEPTVLPVKGDTLALGIAPDRETPASMVDDLGDSFTPSDTKGVSADKSLIPSDSYKIDDRDETPEGVEHDEHDNAVTPASSDATYENKFSHLRYKLDLEFNMDSFERTIHQLSTISDGDTTEVSESLEQLFEGNFGLKTDLALSGFSARETGTMSTEGASAYKKTNGNFQARGLQKQALNLKSALPSENRGSYQVAVNRIALRYKSDTQFSISHFSRFQSQVTALNGSEALDGYTGAAGELAGSASNELMGAFFDTVQLHLGESEAALVAKVEQFFDMAAEELGMSEAALNAAETHLTDSIEVFFDRVSSAVNAQAANHQIELEPTAVQPEVVLSAADLIPDIAQEPIDAEADYLNALLESLEENKESLAELLENNKRSDHDDEVKHRGSDEHS